MSTQGNNVNSGRKSSSRAIPIDVYADDEDDLDESDGIDERENAVDENGNPLHGPYLDGRFYWQCHADDDSAVDCDGFPLVHRNFHPDVKLLHRWLAERHNDPLRVIYARACGVPAVAKLIADKVSGEDSRFQACARLARTHILRDAPRRSYVCESWLSIKNLAAFLYENGFEHGVGKWLDIVDPRLGWYPGNVEIVDKEPSEMDCFMRLLKAKDIEVTAFGETKTLTEWMSDSRVTYPEYVIVRNRIERKQMQPEHALTHIPANKLAEYLASRNGSDSAGGEDSGARSSEIRRKGGLTLSDIRHLAENPPPQKKKKLTIWDKTPLEEWGNVRDEIAERMVAEAEEERDEFCKECGLFVSYGRRTVDGPIEILKCWPPKNRMSGKYEKLTKEERDEVYRQGIAKLREMGKIPPENAGGKIPSQKA